MQKFVLKSVFVLKLIIVMGVFFFLFFNYVIMSFKITDTQFNFCLCNSIYPAVILKGKDELQKQYSWDSLPLRRHIFLQYKLNPALTEILRGFQMWGCIILPQRKKKKLHSVEDKQYNIGYNTAYKIYTALCSV